MKAVTYAPSPDEFRSNQQAHLGRMRMDINTVIANQDRHVQGQLTPTSLVLIVVAETPRRDAASRSSTADALA